MHVYGTQRTEDAIGEGDAIVDMVVQNIRLGGICKHFRAVFMKPDPETWCFSDSACAALSRQPALPVPVKESTLKPVV